MDTSQLDQSELYSEAVQELDELYVTDNRRRQPPARLLAYLRLHPYRPENMVGEEDRVSWPRLISLFSNAGITSEDFRMLGVGTELVDWRGGVSYPKDPAYQKDLIEKLYALLKKRIG